MNDPTISPPFSGLLEREGHTYSNWGISRTTKPAVYVEPISYADVQTVVRDAARFPTPDGGTMLSTRKLDERRLDFQYYEHDIAQINRVIVESYKFTKSFETETGFAPKGGRPIS